MRDKVTLFPGNSLAFSFYLGKVICPQALVAFREHANRLKYQRGRQLLVLPRSHRRRVFLLPYRR
jgi:hypothetical protein